MELVSSIIKLSEEAAQTKAKKNRLLFRNVNMHLFVCVCVSVGVVTLGDILCDGGGDSSSRHIHVSAVGGWRVAFEHFENDI